MSIWSNPQRKKGGVDRANIWGFSYEPPEFFFCHGGSVHDEPNPLSLRPNPLSLRPNPPTLRNGRSQGSPLGKATGVEQMSEGSVTNLRGLGHKSLGVRLIMERTPMQKKKKSRGGSNEPPNLDSIPIHLFFLWGFDSFELLRSRSKSFHIENTTKLAK